MGKRNIIPLGIMTICLAIGASCSTTKKTQKVPELPPLTEVSKLNSDQLDYATLEFDRGETQLSEMDRLHLEELSMKMKQAGKIVDDIKIITWSDRYVEKDEDSTNTEIILARQRAEAIKKYLDKNLPAEEDVDFYNMAENPERYTNFMHRKGVPIEDAFQEEGQKISPDGRALVIIEYQTGPVPSKL
jgi:hypothetical protein